jgi:type VI secretion system protein ImpJ
MAAAHDIHPETFYQRAVEMAGEFATFGTERRRPPAFPPYRHHDLQRTFAPVIAELRRSMSVTQVENAILIPLEERRFGIRVGVIHNRELLTTAAFVLAVRAEMAAESLRRHFPTQVKIGATEQIKDLVNSALPGIKVMPLPAVPWQLPPQNPGVTYFDLDRTGPFWKALGQSGGIAVHLSGDFPRVEMELWAIRG